MRQLVRGGIVAMMGVVAYRRARARAMRWGATTAEVSGALPGDELLIAPSLLTTRAVTIDAPPSSVWPWLVQMGQDRAGFYSYDWLENLLGLDFHNADEIVTEWQGLQIGDQLRSAPGPAGPEAGFTVVGVEPERSIVTVVGAPDRVLPLLANTPLPDGCTWTFVIEGIGADRCRLLVRLRARFGLPAPVEWLAVRVLEPIHFVMERKQLLGIKSRAEREGRDRAVRREGPAAPVSRAPGVGLEPTTH